MSAVYLPKERRLFVWGDSRSLDALQTVPAKGGERDDLLLPDGPASTRGLGLKLTYAAPALAAIPDETLEKSPASVAIWSLASRLALELLTREFVAPKIRVEDGKQVARWCAAYDDSDLRRLNAIAQAMPPAAHAIPDEDGAPVSKEHLLREYIDAVVDAYLRDAADEDGVLDLIRRRAGYDDEEWEPRLIIALTSDDAHFDTGGFHERRVLSELNAWSDHARRPLDRLRTCFRLELPDGEDDRFVLRFFVQPHGDPSLLVPADALWKHGPQSLSGVGSRLRETFNSARQVLLQALGNAALIYPKIQVALRDAQPALVRLTPNEAWAFLKDAGPTLKAAGFGVIVPSQLQEGGSRHLRVRARVNSDPTLASAAKGQSTLNLNSLLDFEWEAALGDDTTVSGDEIAALAKQKASLVRHRGHWIAIDPKELATIQKRFSAEGRQMKTRDALLAALTGRYEDESGVVSVVVDSAFEALIDTLREREKNTPAPAEFIGTLRPYQERGLGWLSTMNTLGLGACLADDMGLGKTVQMLAFLERQRELHPDEERPSLLVVPTSVLGGWLREAKRFAPNLRAIKHYGPERARSVEEIPTGCGTLVVTSYGLLRRDRAFLSKMAWSTVILDEAQAIKNPSSETAKAARALVGNTRFALTGTPVENRLRELWSIMEFLNPGLLGSSTGFRRRFSQPIEREGNPEVAAQLKTIVAPFMLRRLKSDPSVISDLPPKNEMKVFVPLSQEQTTLYQAVLNAELQAIEEAAGIKRRGRVLALLVALKQIGNHPAHYLQDGSSLKARSGKLTRLTEMLEEVISNDEKSLVFTQFREMGSLLVNHLKEELGEEVLFLHGGTPQSTREKMVDRFQTDPKAKVFVLSVKAGGTGLNLMAANHVFHFDRWWNPAVEDQATDRAYRIGQKKSVQVHKMICSGTVEERIDKMLDKKRELAEKVVGTSENWITELDNQELRELFSLGQDEMDVGYDEESFLSGSESMEELG